MIMTPVHQHHYLSTSNTLEVWVANVIVRDHLSNFLLRVACLNLVVQICAVSASRTFDTGRDGLTLSVRVGWVPHRSHSVVVHVRAVLDTPVELLTWFIRLVQVSRYARLHEPSRMVDRGINHTILDGLGDNVLSVLFGVETEFEANVRQGDLRVCQSDGTERSLDDKVTQSQNEEVGRVGVEGLFVLVERLLERCDVSDSYG